MVKRKHDKQTRAFISYAKKWLSCDKYSRLLLDSTDGQFKAEFLKNGLYFDGDKEPRDIYTITLKRGNREFKFKFGNSLNNSVKYKAYTPEGIKTTNDQNEAKKFKAKYHEVVRNKKFKEPSAYDVLASLTKYEVDSFKDFCDNYGYEEDSRKAEKIYNAVVEEWNNIKMLYSDLEIEKLQEIN